MKSNQKTKSGIYKILNKVNGKFYIGSAVYIKGRWGNHRHTLINNKHHNRYLQRSFNKYGAIAFEYIVLEYCEKENLIEREQYYIDLLRPPYNLSQVANSCLGVKHTDPEANYKRGAFCRGKFGEEHYSSIPVYQYNMEGNFIKKWPCVAEVQRSLNTRSASNIGRGTNKTKNSVHLGFIWTKTYQGEKIESMKYRDRSSTCKPIAMLDSDGKIIREFKSQKEASEILGISASNIGSCLTGKSKSCMGHSWKYI